VTLTRREFVAGGAVGLSTLGTAADPPRATCGLGVLLYSFGIRARVEKARGFADPLAFVEFAHARGAAGVQVPLGTPDAATARTLRDRCGELGVHLEGIVRAPADETDLERFAAEVRGAKACGADVLRTVMLGGRRYETFTTAADFPKFAERAEKSLRLAEPVVRRHGVKLAVENHKDYRTVELVDLMKRVGGEHLGVCLDTGNNIALLDDPLATVRALAPWTLTVHLKDMGVEEARDGFLLAEVPLGTGLLDLKAIVGAVRKANPKARFNLEMMTRDPLSIPCLADKYWATLDRVPGRDLARTLAWVRAGARKEPLPRVAKLPVEEQVRAEDRHVRESFAYVIREGLIPVA
jgi:sugar phosphate isomerase/epimerase